MRKNEVVVRILGRLDLMYGNAIDQQATKKIIEEILYDYKVIMEETAIIPQNDMQNKIMLYIATKKIEGLSDITLENYGRHLTKFSHDIMKDCKDITAMDVRIHLINYSKSGVKNSTIATRTDILRGFFAWLANEEYIGKNPMKKIKTIKTENRVREPLTYEELEILRTGCKTLRQKVLFELAYATGLRLQEIENINISDIDWSELRINVIGKGNKERIVYFNARAKVYMQKYLKSRNDLCNALIITERKPIRRLSKRGIQREFDKIQKQSGLKINIYPHKLRHTYASHILDKGASIDVVQELLGHSDLNTTKIYAKSSQSNIKYEYRRYMAN